MKRFFGLLSLFIFLVHPALSQEEGNNNLECGGIKIINNVTVITMDGGKIIENATVVVKKNKILMIKDPNESFIENPIQSNMLIIPDCRVSLDLPKINSENIGEIGKKVSQIKLGVDTINVDGTGKYLVPGMAEMHGHIPGGALNQDLEDLLFLYVSQGVTTVRGMLGADGQFELRDKISAGEVVGPTLYLGGPSFNGSTVSSPNQARGMVRDQVAAGWDFLKIHPGLTLAEYNAMADEATNLGITWGGHVPEDVGLVRALEAGQVTIDHLDGFDVFTGGETAPLDPDRLEDAVQLMLTSGAYVVPTNHLWETLLGLAEKDDLEEMDELKYVTPATRRSNRSRYSGKRSGQRLVDARQNAENRELVLKALSDAGAGIVMGSDAPQLYSVPGFSLLREMEAMADAGMTPEEILRAGSATVGTFFADKDRFGIIAPGHRADLILLDKNPLEDIANMRTIAGVMVNGRWFSREDIDARLTEIEERNKGGSFF